MASRIHHLRFVRLASDRRAASSSLTIAVTPRRFISEEFGFAPPYAPPRGFARVFWALPIASAIVIREDNLLRKW
jgi:hypothetical protein